VRPTTSAGIVAGLVTAAALYTISGYLGFVPGAIGYRRAFDGRRIDAVFQADPGFYLDEIISGHMEAGRGVHPVLHLIWRVPLFHLTRALAPTVPPEVTAVYSARIYVATAAGVGIGWLAAAVVRRGGRPWVLLAFAPVWLSATGHVVAAVPDHFGMSLGVLAAAFAVFLDGLSGPTRPAVVRLIALSAVAGGVTVTNAVLPLWLLAVLVGIRFRDRIRRTHLLVAIGLVAGAVGIGGVGLITFPGVAERFHHRVNQYMNWRLPGRPLEACAYAVRGLVDPVIGPTPAVVAADEQGIAMVSYESPPGAYRRWPYDGWQTAAVAGWVSLFGFAAVRLIRADRAAAVALGGWVGFNLLFHNFWGDEFFLYNPHYSWALAAVAVLGLRGVRWPWVLAAAAVIVGGQWHTLARIRDALFTIPV
jgi:hypothetical protein